MQTAKSYSRRDFLKQCGAASAFAATAVPGLLSTTFEEIPMKEFADKPVAPSDKIRLATIGMGIIGFIDTETALQVPGVEFVAAADLYDGRRIRTQEIFGKDVATTRDYQEILNRPDIDAVIIATSDHWHAQMAIDAMNAGKHVYCEKPMVQHAAEGLDVVAAQRKTKKVLEVGSQSVSSLVYDKAKELFNAGAIGELNTVNASWRRNSAVGAWQYSLPPDASPATVDWEGFQGKAPKRPFDPIRFFRWRNYMDYGTGIPGDLFVHLFSGIHHVIGAKGPAQIMAAGGLHYWKDGRDVPDVIWGLYDYAKSENHPAFTCALSTNFIDGSEGETGTRFIGSEGTMILDGDSVKVIRRNRYRESMEDLVEGYNSVRTFSREMQEKFREQYRANMAGAALKPQLEGVTEFKAPRGYDARLDHFHNFFNAIRNSTSVIEDAVFGLRAAAPAVLTNTSYLEKRVIAWDAEKMRVVS